MIAQLGPELGLGAIVPRTIYDRGGELVNAGDPRFGFKFDGGWTADAVMDGVTGVVLSASNSLTGPGIYIGAPFVVAGAGVAGAALKSTILTITSAGRVTLAAVSVTAVAGAEAHWGTLNTAAMARVMAAAKLAGGRVSFPPHAQFLAGQYNVTDTAILEIDLNRGRWLQYTEGERGLYSTGVNLQGFKCGNGYYRGIPKDSNAAGNSFVSFAGSAGTGTESNADQSDIEIYDMVISNTQYWSVIIACCINLVLRNIRSAGCTYGLQVMACSSSYVLFNTKDGTNYTGSFGVALSFVTWTTTTPANAHNVDLTIVGNITRNTPNAEGIEGHDLASSNIYANNFSGLASGILLETVIGYQHQIQDVEVVGNRVTCAKTGTAGANTPCCIEVSGSAGAYAWTTINVHIASNLFENPNYEAIDASAGWFRTNGAIQDVVFEDNDCRDTTGLGIAIATGHGTIVNLSFLHNHFKGFITSGGLTGEGIGFSDNTNAIIGLLFRKNVWDGATYPWILAANRDLSGAGYQDDEAWLNCTHPPFLNAGAKMLPLLRNAVGDIYSPAGVPTIAVGGALGTGGGLAATIAGTDYEGVITLTSGAAGLGSGTLCTITFGHTLLKAPLGVEISNMTTGAAKYVAYTNTPGTGTWAIFCRVAVDAGQSIVFAYRIIGQI